MILSYRDIFLVLFGAGFATFVNSVSSDSEEIAQAIPVTQPVAMEATVVQKPLEVEVKQAIEVVPPQAAETQISYLVAFDSDANLSNAERWFLVADYFSKQEGATAPNYDLSQPALAATYLNGLVINSELSIKDRLTVADAVKRLQNEPSQPGVAEYVHTQLHQIADPEQQVLALHLLHGATEEHMLDNVVMLLDSDRSEVRLAALEVLVAAPYSDELETRLHKLYQSDQSDEVSERAFVALTKYRESP
ncbi:hypothetical protein ACFSJ3_05870 [Corallincola platygyrae]|uniref:HEAT repeat domain-containing protein n=1 Tax=Corallincola platygyrae TaxID=1193278 RepID=A0ABW4XKK5_9GAMM